MQTHNAPQGYPPQPYVPSRASVPLGPPPGHVPGFAVFSPVVDSGHGVAPPNPHANALETAPTSRAALEQQLRSKVISLLASTANGCIQEIGFGQLCQRLKDSEQEIFSARASYDVLRRENERLIAALDASKDLQAEHQKLREQHQKLTSEYRIGSQRYKENLEKYDELAGHYRKSRDENQKMQREKETLQREVNILRNTRSLSADQQYLLLEMKYMKVLELLRAQALEGSQPVNPTPLDPAMLSLYTKSQNIPFVAPSQRRASEPVRNIGHLSKNPQQGLRLESQRISTSIQPMQSPQMAPILSRDDTSQATQLPSPVDSTSGAGPSVATPLSNLRRDQIRRSSESFPRLSPVSARQPRSTSMPRSLQSLPHSSIEARSQSIPHRLPPQSQSSNTGQWRSAQTSSSSFSWGPVKPDPSSFQASPTQHVSDSSLAGSVQSNAEITPLLQPSPPAALDVQSNTPFSDVPIAFLPDPSVQGDAEFRYIAVQQPALPDLAGVPSNRPFADSGGVEAMGLAPEELAAQHAYNPPGGSSSIIAEEGQMDVDLPSAKVLNATGDAAESKPMIGDDGTLLVDNGAPPHDTQMAEGDDDEEDYSDLTDDEDPGGTHKLSPLECCSEVFYDDDADERHCQMCEMRFERGLISEPPRKFTESSLRELIIHLKIEHPLAWTGLRSGSGQIKEEFGN